MVNKCKVPKCKGHYVSRLNKKKNQLFIGCSEWAKTKCSGKPKGLEWQRVVGVALFAHPEFPNNYWSLSKAVPNPKPDIITNRSHSGMDKSTDDARFAYEDAYWDAINDRDGYAYEL